MSTSVQNIRIEPVNVTWEIEELTQIETVADVASSLQNKYFFIYSGANVKYHVWYNVGGTGVDPAPSGSTAITVAISANATAATVASATNTALDAHAQFESTVSGNVIKVYAAVAGDADDTVDGAAPTGFTFTQCQDGGNIDLGYLDGDVEVSFEQQNFELTAHQTGTSLLAELRQGVSCEIALTLKESDAEKLKEIFSRSAGGTYTPSGGTEVFGWGNNRQGTNTIIQARRLVMHPVALADANYTRDICFWKAYPLPETLVYSGENPQTLSVTFKCYLDNEKPEAVRLFAYGDWTQLVPLVP